MARDIRAPWAEAIPQRSLLMTAVELARLPDDARGYELVDGKLVRMTPTNAHHGNVAADFLIVLGSAKQVRRLGRVFAAETGFLLSQEGEPETVLAPDIAFVRADRLPPPGSKEWQGYLHLAPDLVIEVASPSQSRTELAAKARRWLLAGTRLVWSVWPEAQQVDVWRHGQVAPVATLSISDFLDGEGVIPGFRYPIAGLFR